MRVLAAWDWHRFTEFTVWGVLFWVNALVLVGLVITAVIALVRDRVEKPAPNLTPFLADDDLETRRLERVLGWALVFSAVLAVSYGVYWLREPTRQAGSQTYFDEGAIERGEVLFANESYAVFNAAASLKCADCHGPEGVGGSAPYTYTDPQTGTAYRAPWSAPRLDTVMYRFSPDEVRNIITFGRQGSPMVAWGVAGGGPKNQQSIDDLVAYLASIQVSPEEAQQLTTEALTAAQGQADQLVTDAEVTLDDATTALATASDELAGLAALPDDDATKIKAGRAVTVATQDLADAEEHLAWAQEWADRRAGVTDGQLLFELNCARCHTKNWSIFSPVNQNLKPEDLLGLPGGGGSLGFDLRDGAVVRRFADTLDADGNPAPGSGRDAQGLFVRNGTENEKPYGTGGIGSGRMPGQCNDEFASEFSILEHSGCMLTPEQIDAIVSYERCGLDAVKEDHAVVEYDENCES